MPPKVRPFWYWANLKKKKAKEKNDDEDESPKKKRKTTKSTGKKEKTFYINLQMLSSNHFGVENLKKSELKSVVESLPQCRFDKSINSYKFPLEKYTEIIDQLEEKGIDYKPIPKEVVQLFKKLNKKTASQDSSIDFSNIPPELMDALLPFQLKGVEFALKHEGKCLIGDEMGLGKTIQAIAIACCYEQDWPMLIICPSSVRLNWAKELEKWIPELAKKGSGWSDINVISSSQDRLDAIVNIISYDLVHKFTDELEKKNFQLIIADESHYLKNTDAKRTQLIVPLLQKSKRTILLTGTATLSSPRELYTQLEALGQSIFKSFRSFGIRYCAGWQGPYGWDFSGHSNLTELHLILEETVMIRRLKKDVLSELPKKIRKQIFLEVNSEQIQEIQSEIKKLGQLDKERKQSKLMELWARSGVAKLPSVCSHIVELLSSYNKFLIFAHHKEVLDGIEKCLDDQRVSYFRLDGSTKLEDRQRMVNRFQKDDNSCRVGLLSITAGGTGITLNKAQLVVFAELYWTPGQLIQAEDRAHRIGKRGDLDVQYLIAKETVDTRIWSLIEHKLGVVGETLDGEQQGMLEKASTIDYSAVLAQIEQQEAKDHDKQEDDELRFLSPKRHKRKSDVASPNKKSPKKAKQNKEKKTDDVIIIEESDDNDEDFINYKMTANQSREKQPTISKESKQPTKKLSFTLSTTATTTTTTRSTTTTSKSKPPPLKLTFTKANPTKENAATTTKGIETNKVASNTPTSKVTTAPQQLVVENPPVEQRQKLPLFSMLRVTKKVDKPQNDTSIKEQEDIQFTPNPEPSKPPQPRRALFDFSSNKPKLELVPPTTSTKKMDQPQISKQQEPPAISAHPTFVNKKPPPDDSDDDVIRRPLKIPRAIEVDSLSSSDEE